MMTLKLKQKLSKEGAQLVFRPSIPSSASFLSIVEDYEGRFQEWFAKNGFYSLYSPDKLEVMRFKSDCISYIVESHSEQDQSDNKIVPSVVSAFKAYHDKLKINKLHRLGYGVVKILGSEMNFEDLCKLVYDKFYSSDKKLASISLDGGPKNAIFSLKGQKNGFKNQVDIAPTKRQESLKQFNSDFINADDHQLLDLSDNNLCLIVDVFAESCEKIEADRVDNVLSAAKTEAHRLAKNFEEYISISRL